MNRTIYNECRRYGEFKARLDINREDGIYSVITYIYNSDLYIFHMLNGEVLKYNQRAK